MVLYKFNCYYYYSPIGYRITSIYARCTSSAALHKRTILTYLLNLHSWFSG